MCFQVAIFTAATNQCGACQFGRFLGAVSLETRRTSRLYMSAARFRPDLQLLVIAAAGLFGRAFIEKYTLTRVVHQLSVKLRSITKCKWLMSGYVGRLPPTNSRSIEIIVTALRWDSDRISPVTDGRKLILTNT
jgi:hypothetical protein